MLRDSNSSGKIPEEMCFAHHCTQRAGEAYRQNIPDGFIEIKKRFLACNAYADYEIGKPLNDYEQQVY